MGAYSRYLSMHNTFQCRLKLNGLNLSRFFPIPLFYFAFIYLFAHLAHYIWVCVCVFDIATFFSVIIT